MVRNAKLKIANYGLWGARQALWSACFASVLLCELPTQAPQNGAPNSFRSKFRFLPPNFIFLTVITPFNNYSSILPHLAEVLPAFTPFKNLRAIC
jgi:hypothetical protein